MDKPTKRTSRKPGRKGGKVRVHASIGENLNAAAEVLGAQTFGDKSSYIEHLIMKDLEARGLDLADIIKLGKEWQEARKND